MTTPLYPRENQTPIFTLDFRENQRLVIISYALRALGAVIFGGLFYAAANRTIPIPITSS